jgi:hypothetical protein
VDLEPNHGTRRTFLQRPASLAVSNDNRLS